MTGHSSGCSLRTKDEVGKGGTGGQATAGGGGGWGPRSCAPRPPEEPVGAKSGEWLRHRCPRCGPSPSLQLVSTGSEPGLGPEAQGRNPGRLLRSHTSKDLQGPLPGLPNPPTAHRTPPGKGAGALGSATGSFPGRPSPGSQRKCHKHQRSKIPGRIPTVICKRQKKLQTPHLVLEKQSISLVIKRNTPFSSTKLSSFSKNIKTQL